MTDVIPISSLSDEPVADHRIPTSPRLLAVLDRLPANEVRISNALYNAGINTVADLQSLTDERLRRMKGIGAKYIQNIDVALAYFDLARKEHWIVVRANANPMEAHVQRLQRWIAERVDYCERLEKERIGAANAMRMRITERDTLTDVMLILDGREPTNKRRWS